MADDELRKELKEIHARLNKFDSDLFRIRYELAGCQGWVSGIKSVAEDLVWFLGGAAFVGFFVLLYRASHGG
ncbi:MAG: hypothetical protein LBQ12_14495 [Deltaproteobacteria bacterium]|jgi:hypothetical protein|nr:hypothetical protein [Deltaproteobacteria bacterium]